MEELSYKMIYNIYIGACAELIRNFFVALIPASSFRPTKLHHSRSLCAFLPQRLFVLWLRIRNAGMVKYKPTTTFLMP